MINNKKPGSMPGLVPSVLSLLFSIAEIDSHRLLCFLKTCVTDILAMDKEDDILTDVLGVITHSLESTRTPGDTQRVLDFARILHHARNQLSRDGVELFVDELVILDGAQCGLCIEARERIQRVTIEQPWLRRLFGYGVVKADSAGVFAYTMPKAGWWER